MYRTGIISAQARARYALIAIAALCAWPVSSTQALTMSWNSNNSGNFDVTSNWTPNSGAGDYPNAGDTAVFDRGFVAYEVNFPGGSIFEPPRNYVIKDLRVHTNEVSLVYSGAPFTETVPSLTVGNTFDPLSGSILIGDDADDVAILNMALSSLSGRTTTIAYVPGSVGTLNVSRTFSMSGHIDIGYLGAGALNVIGGGRVESSSGNVGHLAPGVGVATVSGAGSSWTVNTVVGGRGLLNIGFGGTGELNVIGGGKVSSGESRLGPFGAGTATISGAGSQWTNTALSVAGDLTVSAGGSVSSDSVAIGIAADSIGTARVLGAGSSWTTEPLDVGVSGRGILEIRGGGAVTSAIGNVGRNPGSFGQASVDGTGSTWANSDDLTIGNSDSAGNINTLVVSRGGAVFVGGTLLVEPSGAVAGYGNGTLTASVTNRGMVSPGLVTQDISMLVLPGALHIDGSFEQSSIGTLSIHLGGATPGTQYDQLQVSGAVTLNGTLSVALANSFQPSAGQAFDVLDWGSLSGAFSTIQLPVLAAGLSWDTTQLYTTGVLSVVTTPAFTADFDNDGDVDGDDLSQWRGDFGVNGLSDADDDGDSDGADFLAWQQQVGSSAVSSAANVLEPCGIMLALAAMLGARAAPLKRVLAWRAG